MPRGQYDRKAKMTQAQAYVAADTPAQETPAPESVASPRQAAEKAQRRRRNNGDLNPSVVMRLGLPQEVMDDNREYSLRWVNDEGGRIQHLTQQDDYDVVEGVDSRIVGTTGDGKPLVARLLRKPKEFAEEDRKAKIEAINAREGGLIRQANGADPGNSYALPENTIKGFRP
jgi:hypothetical protein